MEKFFIADGEVYRVTLRKRKGNNYDLQEQVLEDDNWSEPIRLGLKGKNITLESALKQVYAYPFYYDSLKKAKRSVKYV